MGDMTTSEKLEQMAVVLSDPVHLLTGLAQAMGVGIFEMWGFIDAQHEADNLSPPHTTQLAEFVRRMARHAKADEAKTRQYETARA
jgi:hypothetical protein